MAVVQISKIQIRRGDNAALLEPSGQNPLPQVLLSSGEMAWGIDTQKLFIGSGWQEGASKTENVEILTVNSNILNLTRSYSYKENFPTLDNSSFGRSLQDRLDERLNAKSFNIQGLPTNLDDGANIQRAINRLYKDSLGISQTPDIRAILEFSPGIYQFTDPIYIYSHTKIIGAGEDRTIFRYAPTDPSQPAFIFIEDPQTDPGTSLSQRQCRNVSLEGFTLEIMDSESPAIKIDYLKNGHFKNISIKGQWTDTDTGLDSLAIEMRHFSTDITCENNIFYNVKINNFKEGIKAIEGIRNNMFDSMVLKNLRTGVIFGYDTTSTPNIVNVGPKNNIIKNSLFERIDRHALKIWQGKFNLSNKNTFSFVGNDGGSIDIPLFGQIEFDDASNLSIADNFDRSTRMISGAEAYVSEITGKAFNQNLFPNTLTVEYDVTERILFRLPLPTSSTAGLGPTSCVIEIDYVYQAAGAYRRLRRGSLTVLFDSLNTNSIPKVNLVDNYEYLGKGLETPEVTGEDEFISFRAGTELKNNKWQVLIYYKYNTTPALGENIEERGTFSYTYKILS